MALSAPEVLQFGRFSLDLGRGFVRQGEREVELRPKTFQVLGVLAENAGKLVSKQDLYEAVWPNVSVTDDSLVQCIREIRSKLGDHTHRLIRTIPRRGYLLDAQLVPTASPADPVELPASKPGGHKRRWLLCGAAGIGILIVALGGMYTTPIFASLGLMPAGLVDITLGTPASELFRKAEQERIAEIASKKELPLPQFRIGKPSNTIPNDSRRFIGVWVSDKGWSVSKRQLMLIVTGIESDGIAVGYVVHGPPQPLSIAQSPAHSSRFQARIQGGALTYSGPRGDHSASFNDEGRIVFKTTFPDGTPGSVLLDPIWTLIEAERTARPG